jgi:uncharacterized protein YbaA (DUF1428 family)
MPKYVDGFLLSVPKKNIGAYQTMSRKASKIWREHGALDYRECVLEDGDAKGMVPFPRAAKAKSGETVVFAWITYKSRAHRDKVNAKVMQDERLCADMKDNAMPFDCKRMAYGGFTTIVGD